MEAMVAAQDAQAWHNTVLVLAPPGPVVAAVAMAASQIGMQVVPAADLEDLVAVPAYLVVIDPTMLDEREWSDWCGWLRDAEDPGQRVLPIGPARRRPGVLGPRLCEIGTSIDLGELAQLMDAQRPSTASPGSSIA